jgi:hypothetical protein
MNQNSGHVKRNFMVLDIAHSLPGSAVVTTILAPHESKTQETLWVQPKNVLRWLVLKELALPERL